jgi:hypothetical protein
VGRPYWPGYANFVSRASGAKTRDPRGRHDNGRELTMALKASKQGLMHDCPVVTLRPSTLPAIGCSGLRQRRDRAASGRAMRRPEEFVMPARAFAAATIGPGVVTPGA